MYHTLVSVVSVLSVLSIKVVTAAPAATPAATSKVSNAVHSILSLGTRRFVMFSDDGQISANGDEQSTLYMFYLAENQLRIQFSNDDYLIFEDGKIQAGKPLNGNDLLEIVPIVGNQVVALRVVHSEVGSGSGSGEMEETPSECYIGFSDENSEPKCYESFDLAATTFVVLEHD